MNKECERLKKEEYKAYKMKEKPVFDKRTY